MNLKKAFDEKEIKDIYEVCVALSLDNYSRLDPSDCEHFEKKYKNALFMQQVNDFKDLESLGFTRETAITFLDENADIEKAVREENKPIVSEVSHEVKKLFVSYAPQTELEKLSYLFDFVTKTVTYPEDWYSMCSNLPQIYYDFDFKDGIPTDYSIDGILAIGQSPSDFTCNLVMVLGNSIGLSIDKEFCTYRENLHAINRVRLSDGQETLIDTARVIRGDMPKSGCFLVSHEDLNKNNQYSFETDSYDLTKENEKDASFYSNTSTIETLYTENENAMEAVQQVEKIRSQVMPKTQHRK